MTTTNEKRTAVLPPDCEICPSCNADWRGQDIFEALKEVRDAGRGYNGQTDEELKKMAANYGWTETNKKTFSRLIGVQYAYGHPKHRDGVSAWQCPDCNARWDRF
jgi:hypothetical protein